MISGQQYAGFENAMVQGAQFFMSNFANRAGSGSTAGARSHGVELGQRLEHREDCIPRCLVRRAVSPFPAARVGIDEHLEALQHAVIGEGVSRLLEIRYKLVRPDAAEDRYAHVGDEMCPRPIRSESKLGRRSFPRGRRRARPRAPKWRSARLVQRASPDHPQKQCTNYDAAGAEGEVLKRGMTAG